MLNVKVLQTKKGFISETSFNNNMIMLCRRGSNPDSSVPKTDVLPITPQHTLKWRLINYWTGAQT